LTALPEVQLKILTVVPGTMVGFAAIATSGLFMQSHVYDAYYFFPVAGIKGMQDDFLLALGRVRRRAREGSNAASAGHSVEIQVVLEFTNSG